MKKKDLAMYAFVFGLVIYLLGLFLLLASSLGTFLSINDQVRQLIKLMGILFFVVGFLLFMVAIIYFYKNNKIKENHKDLIIEGKADVITILVMTYIMIIMLVICLLFDQLMGAFLFAITICIQSILNTILIKYFGNKKKE